MTAVGLKLSFWLLLPQASLEMQVAYRLEETAEPLHAEANVAGRRAVKLRLAGFLLIPADTEQRSENSQEAKKLKT